MTSHAKIDFPALIEPVARIVWGTPNKQLSRPSDIRWGNSGSTSVDPKKGVWHDHESGEGGGCLDLIAREMGLKGRDAIQWMRLQGLPVSEVPTGTGP
jgi:putative DNA primase/helicase